MAAFLTTDSKYTCGHGGKILFVTSNNRTRTGNAEIVRLSDQPFTVDKCPNPNQPKCTQAFFAGPAAKSSILGSAPLTEDSKGTTNVSGVPLPVPVIRISNSSAASGK